MIRDINHYFYYKKIPLPTKNDFFLNYKKKFYEKNEKSANHAILKILKIKMSC